MLPLSIISASRLTALTAARTNSGELPTDHRCYIGINVIIEHQPVDSFDRLRPRSQFHLLPSLKFGTRSTIACRFRLLITGSIFLYYVVLCSYRLAI